MNCRHDTQIGHSLVELSTNRLLPLRKHPSSSELTDTIVYNMRDSSLY